jgi:hypothetical protein
MSETRVLRGAKSPIGTKTYAFVFFLCGFLAFGPVEQVIDVSPPIGVLSGPSAEHDMREPAGGRTLTSGSFAFFSRLLRNLWTPLGMVTAVLSRRGRDRVGSGVGRGQH